MDIKKGIIAVSHSESIPLPLPESLKFNIEKFFKKEVIINFTEKDQSYAFDQVRFQYNAALIIKEHGKKKYSFEKEIILLDVDLFIPIFTHVFGEAKLKGNKSVVSTFRLKDEDNEEITIQRTVKVALHETGHMYGLTHCHENGCLMQFSGDIEHLDKIESGLCDYCMYKLKNAGL